MYICIMRKKYTKVEEVTPSLLKFREKRKWQISLRRYVLEKHPCPAYAPYFGLDIKNMRQWFEYQFADTMSWDSFGTTWQFDHIVPVTYFDFSIDEELFMCWNFTNLRVEPFQKNKDRGQRLDVLLAKKYFEELYTSTGYYMCNKLLSKIDALDISEIMSTEGQKEFIKKHHDYLMQIENYSFFEFELLNRGRGIEEVEKEISILKRIGTPKQ